MSLFNARSVLRTYAHDDVSVGSWMIGLAVKHVNEAKLCCSSWPSGFTISFTVLISLVIDSFFSPWNLVCGRYLRSSFFLSRLHCDECIFGIQAIYYLGTLLMS